MKKRTPKDIGVCTGGLGGQLPFDQRYALKRK